MSYEFLEHTADLKFRAVGESLEEALVEAAKALTHAMVDDAKIEPSLSRQFQITIHKPPILVHDFLHELVYLFSTEQLIFSEFELDLKEAIGYRLDVKLKGERYDPRKHGPVKEVKAVTYHDLKAEQSGDEYVIEVVCDT